MSTPILATKLYIPLPQPKVVLRQRLIEHLNVGLGQDQYFGRKLTLISAPAGFGKTTLVSSWIHNLQFTPDNVPSATTKERQIQNHVAWLSLDEGDNDLTRFLMYVIAALQTIDNRQNARDKFGDGVLALLQSPQPPTTEAILTALLNEITAISKKFVLVLDDYHVIDSTSIDTALTFLIEHLPPQMHIVIATREDPSLPLPRLRAQGQLAEVRAADLRFTATEVARFLNDIISLNLSAEDIKALETRTEGWIAGLQLAAISLQGHQDTSSFIKSFTGSHRFILDYLVEEVIQLQSESVQNFLLHTSILNRMCAPLCDALLNSEEQIAKKLEKSTTTPPLQVLGQETLEYLERANLLVVPLDDQRQWYRYHHLFADALQARAMAKHPDQIRILHNRASIWYEQHHFPSDAIRHALAAENFERAADLIELAWAMVNERPQTEIWLGWMMGLPDALIRARPVLSAGYAWALLGSSKLDVGETRLQDAQQWLDIAEASINHSEMSESETSVVDKTQFQSLPATIAVARAYIAQALGDVSGSIKDAQRALDLMQGREYTERAVPATLLGIAHWTNGDLKAAHQAFNDYIANFQKAGNIQAAINGASLLGDIIVAMGHLNEAIRTYEHSLKLAEIQNEPVFPGLTELYIGLSELYCEQGDLETAAQYLSRSEALGKEAMIPGNEYRLYPALARVKAALGDLDDALHLFDEAERLYYQTPIPDIRPYAAQKVRIWLKQGRLKDALGWVQTQGLSVHDDLSYLREYEHITFVRVLIAQYQQNQIDSDIQGVIVLLTRLLNEAETGERLGSVIEILILQALAKAAQNDILSALIPLKRALTLAEKEGYVRIFINEGAPMAVLLQAAAEQGFNSGYVSNLLAGSEESDDKSTIDPQVGQQLIDPLSDRELDVLRLLKTELTGPEIANELMVSLNTMRTHTKNIYSKLGINNRRAAVRRAEELDLL